MSIWTIKRLSDVCTEITAGGAAPQGERFFQNGKYPFVRVADMGALNGTKAVRNTREYINEEGARKLRLFPRGTVLFTKSGASLLLNQRAVLDCPMYVVSHIGCLIPGKEVTSDWLYYWMRLVDFAKYAHATTLPSLKLSTVKDLELPVPPINKQEEIVSRIEELFSELDNGVETLRKTKQQLAVYRQAVLKDVFDSAVDRETGTILSVCSNIVDCPHSTPKWVDSGKICLRTTNFKRGYLDLSEKNYVSDETFDKRNRRLIPQPGDVLYSREGAILGIACIIPKDLHVCLGQRMMLLRTNEKMLGRFLMHYLNSPKVTSFVATKIGGSASPHVNMGDIKEFIVPIPSISEQQKILEQIESRLSVCDSIEKTIDTALQQAEAMQQSILKQAFEGRL